MKVFTISRPLNEEDLTPKQAKAYDEKYNLRRLSGAEMEAITELLTAGYLLDEAFSVLKPGLIRECRALWACSIPAMVTKLLNVITGHGISIAQKNAIRANAAVSNVILSSQNVAGYVNMKNDDLRQIVLGCTGGWCAYHCERDKTGARHCGIRKALDTVIGLTERRPAKRFTDKCPYQNDWMDQDVLNDCIEMEAKA